MIAVAGFGLAIWVLMGLHQLSVDLRHEYLYVARPPVRKVWKVGPAPMVMVELFAGSVTVLPGADGEVVADIETGAATRVSRAAAEQALDALRLDFHQWRDSVRITVKGLAEAGVQNVVHVKLSVPGGVDLDLRTGRGNLYIGEYYKNGERIRTPLAAASVCAKNASDGRFGDAQGAIAVATRAPPRTAGGSPRPTFIRLDAPGRIDISADDAIVSACAWHGHPPGREGTSFAECDHLEAGAYEREDEGAISFEGSLAAGTHSLYAAHRISVTLHRSSCPRIEAVAGHGRITGNLMPEEVEAAPADGTARSVGSLGSQDRGVLRLRTDDGPIRLHDADKDEKPTAGKRRTEIRVMELPGD